MYIIAARCTPYDSTLNAAWERAQNIDPATRTKGALPLPVAASNFSSFGKNGKVAGPSRVSFPFVLLVLCSKPPFARLTPCYLRTNSHPSVLMTDIHPDRTAENVECMKRKAELLSLQSPRSLKHVKMEDVTEANKTKSTGSETTSSGPSPDSSRGNITIIHVRADAKHGGSRMQWTFPRAYLTGRTRSSSPQTPGLPKPTTADAELNTASLNGSFTPDAIAVFYQAITSESSVPSSGHTLAEYCQIQVLAQFFGVQDIFQDGEVLLLRKVMADDTPLDIITTASSLASIFRCRALVERCRVLLGRRIRALLEIELKTMNCGGLNTTATKLDEVYQFLQKSATPKNIAETRR
jgi:hypothetical protein